MFWKSLVAALFVVGVFGEFELADDKKQKIQEQIKKQCDNVHAPDNAAGDISTSIQSFSTCLTDIVNVETLKQEIEDAKPKGALDEVFKKYCAKAPAIKGCINNLLDAFTPCLDTSSKAHIPSAKNGTDQLIDFVCYKDGDRIALFIAEKGPECFLSKKEAIRECGEKARGELSISDFQNLRLEEKCAKIDEVTTCTVTALESCDTPTPSNMAESIIKYIRKSSPCHTALPKDN